MMRERTRRHDDVHFPLGGRGKRATPPRVRLTTKKIGLTALEVDVILGMLGDVDPAHFEGWEEPERTRREKAHDSAKAKLERVR